MSNNDETALTERRTYNKSVAADTAITASGNMAFRNIDQIMNFAKVMALAGVAIPKHLRESPGACMAVCIQAAEWQMSPFAVANKSYSVNDRLAYEAQLVNAVILRRAPIMGRFKIAYSGAGDTRRCKVSAKLNDGSGEEVEYESPELKSILVKNSPLWKSDPDQQLFYYSSRAMCRRHFPDVILGIYTQDEMEELPEREVRGREIPAAKVPDLLPPSEQLSQEQVESLLKPGSVTHVTAGQMETIRAGSKEFIFESKGPNAREEFRHRCLTAGLTASRVFEILAENAVTDGLADDFHQLTEDECRVALEQFDNLVAMVKGGQP